MGFINQLSPISFIGKDLNRPECVLATKRGDIISADWRGGVCRIHENGQQDWVVAKSGKTDIKPNGIALEETGNMLIADLSNEGGVYRLHQDGQLDDVLLEVDGRRLPATNYVLKDHLDRIWVTVSTRLQPRSLGYRSDNADGFIILIDSKGSRIVADCLGYTNEVRLSPDGNWLYVVETFGRKLSRFKLSNNGSLRKKETVAEFGYGIFPDGMAFDCERGIWVTSIISNRLIRIDPKGNQEIMIEDMDPDFVESAESAFESGSLGRKHLDSVDSRMLGNISSIAFGGKDLKTIYLGCLLGDSIAMMRSPVAGVPPVHWGF